MPNNQKVLRRALEPRPLTLVHLSDIHFQSGLSEVSKYDVDAPLRHAILRDLDQLCKWEQFKRSTEFRSVEISPMRGNPTNRQPQSNGLTR